MTESDRAGGDLDVVDILTTDHQEMLELLGRIEHTADGDQRRDLADTVTAEVMRHAVAEEMYVYPVLEHRVPEGAAEVERDKAEHEEIVEVMKEMEGIAASEPTFMELVRRLDTLLRRHAGSEELEQFPSLRSHLPPSELVEIGRKVETAKKIAPTRPHPSAPHSELFHKSIGAGIGMVDRLRDKLTGRSTG